MAVVKKNFFFLPNQPFSVQPKLDSQLHFHAEVFASLSMLQFASNWMITKCILNNCSQGICPSCEDDDCLSYVILMIFTAVV